MEFIFYHIPRTVQGPRTCTIQYQDATGEHTAQLYAGDVLPIPVNVKILNPTHVKDALDHNLLTKIAAKDATPLLRSKGWNAQRLATVGIDSPDPLPQPLREQPIPVEPIKTDEPGLLVAAAAAEEEEPVKHRSHHKFVKRERT